MNMNFRVGSLHSMSYAVCETAWDFPEHSAAQLIGVLDALMPSQTGLLFDHMGVQLAF